MLKTYTLEDCEKWDQIVRSFSDYDVYYLSGYVKAFQLHGDGTPLLFYYESSGIRGINVVMKRDIALDEHFTGRLTENTYFDFSTPYGYGGWLIENPQDDNIERLFKEYEEYCRKKCVVSEFVRFHPLIKNHGTCGFYYEIVPRGEVVAMDLASSELIWDNFLSKNRNMIRKAVKNGVRIYNGRYPEIYKIFHKIYNKTMDKDHASQYYYFTPGFYESILNDLEEEAQVFYAQIPDGTIIAASVMLAANGRMTYHLSGSLQEYSHLAPTNLLLYRAALWGSVNGCRTLYLGGGVGSEEDSLLMFKKSFYRGNLERFYTGNHIFDKAVYKELIGIRKEDDPMIEVTEYFPKYRGGN